MPIMGNGSFFQSVWHDVQSDFEYEYIRNHEQKNPTQKTKEMH